MAVGKEIRTKISSIQSTQKITSAMEMVAASKMRRAQDRMEQDVEVAKIGDFESALLGYMRAECGDVMQAIEADGGWDDDREAAFKSAIETFKSTQTW